MLERQKFAGTADAGLNFIEHHQQIMLVAEGAYAVKVVGSRDIDAALALDRLDQNGNNIAVLLNCVSDSLNIVIRYANKAFNQGCKALLYFSIACGA